MPNKNDTHKHKVISVKYVDSGLIDEQIDEVAKIHVLKAVGYVIHEDSESATLAREYDFLYSSRGNLWVANIDPF